MEDLYIKTYIIIIRINMPLLQYLPNCWISKARTKMPNTENKLLRNLNDNGALRIGYKP